MMEESAALDLRFMAEAAEASRLRREPHCSRPLRAWCRLPKESQPSVVMAADRAAARREPWQLSIADSFHSFVNAMPVSAVLGHVVSGLISATSLSK